MTSSLIPLAGALHTLGAVIGAAFVTYAEIFYTFSASDGKIDHHERKYLRHLYRGLKFGLVLVIVSATALIVLEYLVPDAPQDVLLAPFWFLQTLTILILVYGWRLSKGREAWWIASAAILTAWWMMVAIDFGYLNSFGYVMLAMLYVLVTFIAAGILHYIRVLARHPLTTPE